MITMLSTPQPHNAAPIGLCLAPPDRRHVAGGGQHGGQPMPVVMGRLPALRCQLRSSTRGCRWGGLVGTWLGSTHRSSSGLRAARISSTQGSGYLDNRKYWNEVLAEASSVALVTSKQILAQIPNLLGALDNPLVVAVPDGEAAKSLAVVADVYHQLGQARFPRTGVIVGVGGGSVTDLAGFIAGAWKRGVRLVQAPTTLTGQVDAALGGKAGVNLPEGKNLVGVIYQPERMVAARGVLRTVPNLAIRGGMAEVIKCGFIADPAILQLLRPMVGRSGCDP
jgi:3-dehydroquinate synthetase